jgi:hypothetical protein
VFDQTRHLQYEGRVDNSYRTELVKTQDARNAVDALLAHKEIPTKHTGVFGCSTKWQEKQSSRIEALQKLDAQPVQLETATADDLKKLRANPKRKMMLENETPENRVEQTRMASCKACYDARLEYHDASVAKFAPCSGKTSTLRNESLLSKGAKLKPGKD